jgi:hypothetical protein
MGEGSDTARRTNPRHPVGATVEVTCLPAATLHAQGTWAFSKLGLKPELVSKAVPVLTQFVSKSGGANVGSLLAGVLK